ARQLDGKLIEKLYRYSKNATNTVHDSHISVHLVKKARQLVSLLCQKNIQLAGKTFTLVKHLVQGAKRHSCRPSSDLSETPCRWLITLLKNLFRFPYTLFGLLVSYFRKTRNFSKKHSSFQNSVQPALSLSIAQIINEAVFPC
ncbi:MAG: hypothetical protein LBS35_01425, partial [Synergistaceae bacterium]|nr:hypothetical protein [Synergistaceae bacterium]